MVTGGAEEGRPNAALNYMYDLLPHYRWMEDQGLCIEDMGRETGKSVARFDSNFVLAWIVVAEKPTHIAYMYLESHGVVGLHQASVPQLLLIFAGQGWVRDDTSDVIPVGVGDAILWNTEEWHEMKSLNPAEYLSVRDSD